MHRMSSNQRNLVDMKWEYGKLRSEHSWIIWVNLATGIFATPMAWLLRDSLSLGRAPLPPWTVLLVGIALTVAGLCVSIALSRARSRPANLITIKDEKITVPGSFISGHGWSLPLADLKVRVIDLGFVKQLNLSGRRKRKTLSSALFTSESDFNLLVAALSQVE